jgi:hypothetical protein
MKKSTDCPNHPKHTVAEDLEDPPKHRHRCPICLAFHVWEIR